MQLLFSKKGPLIHWILLETSVLSAETGHFSMVLGIILSDPDKSALFIQFLSENTDFLPKMGIISQNLICQVSASHQSPLLINLLAKPPVQPLFQSIIYHNPSILKDIPQNQLFGDGTQQLRFAFLDLIKTQGGINILTRIMSSHPYFSDLIDEHFLYNPQNTSTIAGYISLLSTQSGREFLERLYSGPHR